MFSQSTNKLLLVSPTAFASNVETAVDNSFMASSSSDEVVVRSAAMAEHAALCDLLQNVIGCQLYVVKDADPTTPDSCFPNNLFSTHHPQQSPSPPILVHYPMRAVSRQREWTALHSALQSFGYNAVIEVEPESSSSSSSSTSSSTCSPANSSSVDQQAEALEGTGSLVLDRLHSTAYMVISMRSSTRLAQQLIVEKRKLPDVKRLVVFHAVDAQQRPIYHTNVVMAIGMRWAVVCLEAIPNRDEQQLVMESLRSSHGESQIIVITLAQVDAFCGNILEVLDRDGRPAVVMSSRARSAFAPTQLAVLAEACPGGVHDVSLETIERIGGGGVRCCIAELFGI